MGSVLVIHVYAKEPGVDGVPNPDTPNYDLYLMGEVELRAEVIKLRAELGR